MARSLRPVQIDGGAFIQKVTKEIRSREGQLAYQ